MVEISSRTNVLFRKFQSLTESKGLKQTGLFLLSGRSLVEEFLLKPTLPIEAEVLTAEMSPSTPLKSRFQVTDTLFDELDILGTHSPLLIVRQPEIKPWDFTKLTPGLQLLVPLGDPSNLGAVVRSAEAFGIENVILLREAAHPFLPKAVKAAAGSMTRIKLWRGPSIQELTAPGLVALDLNGESLNNFKWPEAGYLLVGEEGAGLPSLPELQKISIPTQKVESLNATVATSIALYDYSQKLRTRN